VACGFPFSPFAFLFARSVSGSTSGLGLDVADDSVEVKDGVMDELGVLY